MEQKKKIAALTGVLYYLEEEKRQQETALGQMHKPAITSPWALYGRQSIMQMRSLIQRRVLKK